MQASSGPVSPFAWWIFQLALSALVLRWAWRTLKGMPFGVLAAALAAWLYLTVPGAGAVARAWLARIGPPLLEFISLAGERLVNGFLRLFGGG